MMMRVLTKNISSPCQRSDVDVRDDNKYPTLVDKVSHVTASRENVRGETKLQLHTPPMKL